jgi:hypothetical protein
MWRSSRLAAITFVRQGTQPRAHPMRSTHFPRRARPSSQLSASPIFCRCDLGRRKGMQRGVYSMRSPTVRPPSPLDVRAHACSLCPVHVPGHVRRHTQRPTPVGRKKGRSDQRVREGKIGRTSHRGTSSRWTSTCFGENHMLSVGCESLG